ncbi:DUF4129 domain-containing protein [Planococcus sp. APC 4015]|nr:DUF4129 domain-containing protein [Planococcus sp. APC 4015]
MRLSAIPLVPDGDEAREWAERELSDPVYREAEPTLLDRIARAVADFIGGLFETEVDGQWGLLLALLAAAIVVVIIVAAFLVWGLPRSTRRVPPPTATLFGDADARSSAELRAAATAQAAAGEWEEAIVLRFRALARALTERGVVETPPGTTVHGFARAAGRAFPASTDALEAAAAAFDDVRYLRRRGTSGLYARVVDVDDAIADASPTRERHAVGATP